MLQLIRVTMSTDVLCDILKTVRKHSNISIKVEILSKNNVSMTTITLKECVLPSWSTAGTPEGKWRKAKKTPSKLRRDAKRRETYLAKKTEAEATVTIGQVLSSLPSSGETLPPLRRTATPKRRLENQNAGGEGDGEDLNGIRGGHK